MAKSDVNYLESFPTFGEAKRMYMGFEEQRIQLAKSSLDYSPAASVLNMRSYQKTACFVYQTLGLTEPQGLENILKSS